jgi:hypothetical protein
MKTENKADETASVEPVWEAKAAPGIKRTEETANTEAVEEVSDAPIIEHTEDGKVVVDGFVLDPALAPVWSPVGVVELPPFAANASFGWQMHNDLVALGWTLLAPASEPKTRGLVYKAPYYRPDGTRGVTLRVNWQRK